MKNIMELKFSANIENELFARMSVISFVSIMNPTVDEVNEIKTIVSEAVTNSIIHGYDHDSNKMIEIYCECEDKDIIIEIKDFGVGIKDIELAKQPLYTTRPEIERSGMGLTIIEAFSDEVKILSDKNGTTIEVHKTLKNSNTLTYV